MYQFYPNPCKSYPTLHNPAYPFFTYDIPTLSNQLYVLPKNQQLQMISRNPPFLPTSISFYTITAPQEIGV